MTPSWPWSRSSKALGTASKQLTDSVHDQLAQHPDASVFTSLPRAGQLNAAQIPAEWGDARSAYDSPDAVAAFAAVALVTKASGRHHALTYRWSWNKRLRQAITTFAGNSRHDSPWAAEIYRRARDRGMDHPHAVRVLTRAWITVIYRCRLDGVPYDPAKHGAAAAQTKQAITPTAA